MRICLTPDAHSCLQMSIVAHGFEDKNKVIRLEQNTRTKIQTPQLLLSAREAAKALSVCEKTLWSMTKRGELPVVRIGRSVRYSIDDLKNWIQKKSENCA